MRSRISVKGMESIVKRYFFFFFLTFYFEINLELKKRLKDSTEISCICFVQLSLMLASYTTVAQPAKPGN